MQKGHKDTAYSRLDRSKFKMQTLEEADHQLAYWATKTPAERLAAAAYLNSVAWGYDLENPPRMDKTAFSRRTHEC